MTNTLPPESSPQFLDKLKVERERGITVKAQTVSIILKHTDGKDYLVNLIDTPGHVDFSYEVSRSLGACEGALLLVDCTQGIQAQTLSVFHVALEADLKMLAVINKVDLAHAYPEETSNEIAGSLGIPVEDHMRISAKSGLGVDNVLHRVIDSLPPPNWQGDNKLRALVFDTFYDRFRGVVSLVRIVSGSIKKGDKVRFIQAGKKYDILDVGVYNPEEVVVDSLNEGQVGYVVCNMKNSDEAFIGDTVCLANDTVEPLPGFQPMKAMVYAGVFPLDGSEFVQLEESLNRLTLNDRSVSVERETSAALGQGFRLGFLGTLHMDVFRQRLEDEYQSQVIVTAPTVPYKVVYHDGREVFISNPAEFPDTTDTRTRVTRVEEPMVNATIFVPNDYLGDMMDLCARYRGVQQEYKYMEGSERAILKYSLPLAEIVTDFFSELKSASSGFASFDYEEAGYEESKLVKLNMLLNGKPVDALSMIVHRNAAQTIGKAWVKKLRDVLPRQLFELAIQAAVGARVVARETLSAMRKDVTAGLYGGHYERKMKHLNKQKEGKKRLKSLAGNISVPQTAFYEVLSSRPRGFATCARRSAEGQHGMDAAIPLPPSGSNKPQEHDDWLLKYFPRSFDLNTPPPPLARPSLTSGQRSSMMSNLQSQTFKPDGWDSSEIFSDFTQLYLSSSSPMFTSGELRNTALAVHTLDRRAGRARKPAQDRLDTIYHARGDLVGPQGKLGLELPLLVSQARKRRQPSVIDLRRAQRHFNSLWASVPEGTKERQLYTMSVNHILYLSAITCDYASFEAWWERRHADGIPTDSYAHLARLIMVGKGRGKELDEMLPHLQTGLQVVQESDAIVLINCVLSMAAKENRMDILVMLWDALKWNVSLDEMNVPETALPPALFDLVASVHPDRYTYTIVAHALAARGDLTGSLEVLQMVVSSEMNLAVQDYLNLFHGFARYGVIPSVPSGAAADAFPPLTDYSNNFATVDNPWSLREDGAELAVKDPRWSTLWTLESLHDLWPAFMSVSPPEGHKVVPRAPHHQWVFRTLLGWSRVTNGDPEAVAKAFIDMERKFGPGNPEGWVFWEESNRIRKVRDVLGLGEQHH